MYTKCTDKSMHAHGSVMLDGVLCTASRTLSGAEQHQSLLHIPKQARGSRKRS